MALNYWNGPSLSLRAIQTTDISLFRSFDDEVSRNVDAIYWPQSDERGLEWLNNEQKPRNDDSFRFIAENLQGELIGTIDTFACNRRNGTFKYGLAVAPIHRSNGYAKEMINLVLRFYFYELNYHKVTPHVYSFNKASLTLHEKLGFVKEGQLRNMVYTNGSYFDEIHFGMTKSEFETIHGSRSEDL
jgi:RimJ/RimL family protein N-acetyltransferase